MESACDWTARATSLGVTASPWALLTTAGCRVIDSIRQSGHELWARFIGGLACGSIGECGFAKLLAHLSGTGGKGRTCEPISQSANTAAETADPPDHGDVRSHTLTTTL